MNDRFVFRGKRKDNGEWLEGWYGAINEGDTPTIEDRNNYAEFFVDLSTVGQCTGLRDMVGNLIFEGDVVKATPINDIGNDDDWKDVRREVIFTDGAFCLRRRIGEIHDTAEMRFFTNIEVVGNIHSSPDLLEVKE